MSLYKKAGGKNWYWRYRYTDANHKSHSKDFNTDILVKGGSKKEAERIGRQKEAEYIEMLKEQSTPERHKERKLAHKNDTVTEYATYWLEERLGGIKDNTKYSYELVINKHVIPLIGALKMSELDQFDLEWLIEEHIKRCKELEIKCEEKRKKGRKITNNDKPYYNSIKKIMDITSMMLKDAVANAVIPDNPAKKISKCVRDMIPKSSFTDDEKPDPYSIDELNLLIEKCKGTVLEPCIMLAAYLGLRREEVLGLKWEDIDFTNNIVYIRNTVVTTGGKNIYRDNTTKNTSSKDKLPLVKDLRDYLLRLKQKQYDDAKLYGDCYIQSDYICRWDDGKLIKPNYISQTFPKFLKDNNLRKIRFHDLRDTVVTLVWEKTHDIKIAQVIARHSNITTTADIYTRAKMDDKQDALNKVFNDKESA